MQNEGHDETEVGPQGRAVSFSLLTMAETTYGSQTPRTSNNTGKGRRSFFVGDNHQELLGSFRLGLFVADDWKAADGLASLSQTCHAGRPAAAPKSIPTYFSISEK